MADPNDAARRRRRARQAANQGYGSNYGASSHPTLTPKGLEMMRTSPLKDSSYAMPMPQFHDPRYYDSQGGDSGGWVNPRVGNDLQAGVDPGSLPPGGIPQDSTPQGSFPQGGPSPEGEPPSFYSGQVRPGPFFSKKNWRGLPQNLLPSQKFPDPNSLIHEPLRRYFETRQVGQADGFPSKAIGRMVIHVDSQDWNQPAFGSAWIVGPRLIATCAHNLFDSNKRRWSRAIEFYPGFNYYDGTAPVQCNVTSCYIPQAYLDNPATNDDIGFCHVDRNIGEEVGETIPIVPPENNAFFENHQVTIAGYPASSQFDFGKQLWVSRGEYLFGHSMGPSDDYSPVLATDFGGGASGGPWLAQDPQTKKWTAVGLTSGHARLHYTRGELNLMSLTSPMLTQVRMDRLVHEQVFHTFES